MQIYHYQHSPIPFIFKRKHGAKTDIVYLLVIENEGIMLFDGKNIPPFARVIESYETYNNNISSRVELLDNVHLLEYSTVNGLFKEITWRTMINRIRTLSPEAMTTISDEQIKQFIYINFPKKAKQLDKEEKVWLEGLTEHYFSKKEKGPSWFFILVMFLILNVLAWGVFIGFDGFI